MFTISAASFNVLPSRQNVYVDPDADRTLAQAQHAEVRKALGYPAQLHVPESAPVDIVFAANCGLSLPNLPVPTFILSRMKYASRRAETPYIQSRVQGDLVQFPGPDPFEGEGECSWFHQGRLLVVGYGFRCTRRSVRVLEALLNRIYEAHGVTPPRVVAVKLTSPLFYHLDLAFMRVGDDRALVNPAAVRDLSPLQDHIHLTAFKTDDTFALNSVIQGKRLITHKVDSKTRRQLEKLTGKKVVEVDVSEFEKAGGSIRCMVCFLF